MQKSGSLDKSIMERKVGRKRGGRLLSEIKMDLIIPTTCAPLEDLKSLMVEDHTGEHLCLPLLKLILI